MGLLVGWLLSVIITSVRVAERFIIRRHVGVYGEKRMSKDEATFVNNFEGRGYITVLDVDGEPTDEVDEYDEQDGGRFREWRVEGVTFDYVSERTHAPLIVRESGSAGEEVRLRPSDRSKEGVESTEEYRMRGMKILLDVAFRHPQNDSLRFKVERLDEDGGTA